MMPVHADEVTIQRIATARAIKATRLMYALMTDRRCVTGDTIKNLTDEEKAGLVERAGVKVASPLTWRVVEGAVKGIVAAANAVPDEGDEA